MDAYAVLKLAGSLALIVAMIYLAAWLIRKLDRHQARMADTIKILDTRSVDPKHSVVVAEISGIRLVLGITPQSMSLLQVLPQPLARVDPTIANSPSGSEDSKAFDTQVAHARGQP